jgi:dihydrofolate reductase
VPWLPAAAPSSPPAAGAVTTTTECRSSSSAAGRRPEDEEARWPLVTYVSDVAEAMAAAKEAAGTRDVLVHGAGTAQMALAAGVLDEVQIHLVPVLLGEGRRLFENLGPDHIELEPTRVLEGEGVTHLRYRVAS